MVLGGINNTASSLQCYTCRCCESKQPERLLLIRRDKFAIARRIRCTWMLMKGIWFWTADPTLILGGKNSVAHQRKEVYRCKLLLCFAATLYLWGYWFPPAAGLLTLDGNFNFKFNVRVYFRPKCGKTAERFIVITDSGHSSHSHDTCLLMQDT